MNDQQMIEFFGTLDVPEGAGAELLRGDIVMTRSPDLVHNRTVEGVQEGVPRDRWHRLQCQYVEMHREASEPVHLLVVLERSAGPHSGRLLPVEAVTMLVEVVSRAGAHRDYVTKRSIHAAAGVPVYLIVDPAAARCLVLTQPCGRAEHADYRSQRGRGYGEILLLPESDTAVDTGAFRAIPAP
ncbi:Uma2 family endonuclease [Streptomyces gibsoniae]|uniref:Uma2 family endonuclease n=1 Tax=Streptomyces gibsoniae TaxID=3075529 RepID=A0ABU2U1L7_9ACTN|nr:Uma2 family endonuclease [Streptomyces sp. DSM 41699]MDT0466936.1 Uma2 family endonuclease [Streptomyces sp. DSM 41699]